MRRLLVVLLSAVSAAHAAPPLNTDDAGVLPPGACQLELRVRGGAHPQQQYMQPSCNPGGPIEWALNVAHAVPADAPAQTLLGLQGKTPLAAGDGYGATFSAAVVHELRRGVPATTGFATLIGSIAPSSALAAHLNLGLSQVRGRHAVANWGAALELAVGDAWTLLGERYGERHGRPATQIGARTWLRPNVLQLDATLGREHVAGSGVRYATLGLVWVWSDALSASRP
jgi:hypothetical protein